MRLSRFKNPLSPFWTLQLLGWGAYGLMIYITFLPVLPAEGGKLRLLHVKLVRTIIGFGLTVLLHRIYKYLWARNLSFHSIALIALSGSVLFGCLWLVLSNFYAWWTDPAGFQFEGLLSKYPREALDYSYVILAWSASYFGIKYWQDLQAEKERALRASALAHQAQLEMLRYQLNPHFLFNALNSIRASIDEDQARARRMITEFSEFLRYSLLNTISSQVPLREEMEAVRNYLAIEKIRFEVRLEVLFDVEPAAADYRLPGFLIHPLVENAIKHGMRAGSAPLVIRLKARVRDGALHLEVANTGAWTGTRSDGHLDSNGTGIGLQNVRQRLNQLFPGRNCFEIREEDGWIKALIEINKAAA